MTQSLKRFKKEVIEDSKKTNVLPKSRWDAKRGRFKDPAPEKQDFKKLDGPAYPRLSDYQGGE